MLLLISSILTAQIKPTTYKLQEVSINKYSNYTSIYSKELKTSLYTITNIYKSYNSDNKSWIQPNYSLDLTNILSVLVKDYSTIQLAPSTDYKTTEDLNNTYFLNNYLIINTITNNKVWNPLVTSISKLSNKDSLLVITGAYDYKSCINGIGYPNKLFKIVKNLTKHTIIAYEILNDGKSTNPQVVDVYNLLAKLPLNYYLYSYISK